MPNRIIKESITTSCEVDNLTPEEERFFYRLIVACDDYGRMDARTPMLRAKCFPLKIDSVKDKDIENWLSSLIQQHLIQIYIVGNKPYLQMTTWEKHQQVRAKRSKFPAPDNNLQADDINCNQLQSNVPENPYPYPYLESESVSLSVEESSADVFKFYDQNFPGTISSILYDKLTNWITDTEEALVLYALEKSVLAEKRSFSYAEGILNNWIGKGIKTRKDAEIEDSEYKRKKEKAKDPPVAGPALYTEDFAVSEEEQRANHERIKALTKNIGKGIGE